MKIHKQLQKIMLDGSACNSALVQRHVGAVQHAVWTNFPKSTGGPQNTPSTWNGYLNMTGIDGLAALKLRK